ncbi:unnamed protein product [Rotaria socialis]|uniref:protein-tyrosine-phosphatase n=1 Tax=Rotaria socialis TaxID=392032 RepID=A0A817YDP3_9BILA|nr:unnamed protein product [Rotaria socialis]CAF3379275.1 unnamed protein product [Rotaria socialis]CAF3432373.1 unnamed protein product [Rotaria socialis]CAF3437860.1 unnamed protein product [Rotaria socialis]CAF3724038.1 unnamed protein product [Rotaria socialis]
MSQVKHYQPTESTAATHLNQILAAEVRLNRLHRLFKTQFNVTEPSIIIEPYLFLGNCISAHDTHRLSKLGIRYILNVAIRDVELCPYYSSDIRTLPIDLRDDDQEDIIRIFNQAFTFIDEAKRNKSRVLVHCSHGQSRSPAIVIAYLMHTYNVSLEQCIVHVVKARPCVLPNDGFLKQLILFDRFLVEKQRQRQEAAAKEAAAKEAVNTTSVTEITIQHKPSVTPQPEVPTKYLASEISTDKNTSPVASSTLKEISKSKIKSSKSSDSVHFIPIQVPIKVSRPEKVKQVKIRKIPVKDESTSQEMKKKTKNRHEKSDFKIASTVSSVDVTSSNHVAPSKKRPNAYITSIVRPETSPTYRSHSTHSDHINTNNYDYYPPSTTTEQWNDYTSCYRNGRRSREPEQATYITEVYDKATNRFIPTTC